MGNVKAADADNKNKFGFEDVVRKAKALSGKSYRQPAMRVPNALLPKSEGDKEIYDNFRDIRFKKDKTLWLEGELPFQVQMFHLGLYFKRPVKLHVVDHGKVEALSFSPDFFDYGRNDIKDQIPADLGFAGFRIHTPLNTPNYYDEVAVFLGASYFRAVGRHIHYGLSARGLAIDTASSSGEEFPYFTSFWLNKPEPEDSMIVVFALLDSPSITGAYRFEITPGIETAMRVEMRLFPREGIDKLGIAPLTSMFSFGENTTNKPVDFRPEVHDSDGLVIESATGEWIWRPIQNNRSLLINSFAMKNPRGFGLVQRDRDFDHYQDLEARYDNRPSSWIVPEGQWGEGRIELVQIPTADEYHDNIVAFWVPKEIPKRGDELAFSYRLRWHLSNPSRPNSGYVDATRVVPGNGANVRKIVLDYLGGQLEELPADAKVEAVIDVGNNGKLLEHQVLKNELTNGWRVVIQVRRENDQPLELRVSLKRGQDYLTETWNYSIIP
ncbi:MAG: glucan biosynthesis protein G [Gammaproteobacteria bacterium]|nr:glucan biosynthesis protein G [Gammaproteobacteria bacterium]